MLHDLWLRQVEGDQDLPWLVRELTGVYHQIGDALISLADRGVNVRFIEALSGQTYTVDICIQREIVDEQEVAARIWRAFMNMATFLELTKDYTIVPTIGFPTANLQMVGRGWFACLDALTGMVVVSPSPVRLDMTRAAISQTMDLRRFAVYISQQKV